MTGDAVPSSTPPELRRCVLVPVHDVLSLRVRRPGNPLQASHLALTLAFTLAFTLTLTHNLAFTLTLEVAFSLTLTLAFTP